eukprot:TRINITY_DN44053_c0_g1_i1.p1 TRINITY_DN44053_c0_g1~~TRINITY_DN44053_c0_g1_i1.p1  ORF type:complete len:614 (-),score=104.24 TRINITY_DN44053_c0_g1_i1:110-1951(-)
MSASPTARLEARDTESPRQLTCDRRSRSPQPTREAVGSRGAPHKSCDVSAGTESSSARLSAAENAYPQIWNDFLLNRRTLALQRATALLQVLGQVPAADKYFDDWVAEADFSYIAGAIQENCEALLLRALEMYDRCLASTPLNASRGSPNVNARRMRAETLLRLRRYEEAFEAFSELSCLRGDEVDAGAGMDALAPRFRLEHDAAMWERLCQLGRLEKQQAEIAAEHLRSVATRIKRGTRPKASDLSREDQQLLKAAFFDEMWRLAPYPDDRLTCWEGAIDKFLPTAAASPAVSPSMARERTVVAFDAVGKTVAREAGAEAVAEVARATSSNSGRPLQPTSALRFVLRPSIDFVGAQQEYMRSGVLVIDDFFAPGALAELWRYSMETPSFRTVRAGFLGAFPSDGFSHPLVIQTARALEKCMPQIFGVHPLGLWWLFKYTNEAPKGIGIHADVAAVNVNIWLTPNEARRSGGGLDIFSWVPPDEASVHDFNREFSGPEEELALRRKLEVHGVHHVEYCQNRAVIFVSDLFHVSEPFEFIDSTIAPRVNLTLLFGDRAGVRRDRGGNVVRCDDVMKTQQCSLNTDRSKDGSTAGECGEVDVKLDQSSECWDIFD